MNWPSPESAVFRSRNRRRPRSKPDCFGGRSACRPVTAFDTSRARAHVAGHIDDFDPAAFIAPAKLRRIDRVGQLSIAACRLALEDAHLSERVTGPGPRHRRGARQRDRRPAHRRHATSIDCGRKDRRAHRRSISATPSATPPRVCAASNSACAASTSRSDTRKHRRCRRSRTPPACCGPAAARAIVTGGVDDFERMYFTVYDRFRALAQLTKAQARRRVHSIAAATASCSGAAPSWSSSRSELGRPHAARGRYARLSGVGMTSSPCGCTTGRPIRRSSSDACARRWSGRESNPRDVAVVFASANSSRQARSRRSRRAGRRIRTVRRSRRGGQGRARRVRRLGGGRLSSPRSCRCGRARCRPPSGSNSPIPTCPVDVSGASRPIDQRRPSGRPRQQLCERRHQFLAGRQGMSGTRLVAGPNGGRHRRIARHRPGHRPRAGPTGRSGRHLLSDDER